MIINKEKVCELRKEYGDAFYLLDSEQFRNNFLELKEAFSKIYPKFNIAYSYKTNYTPKFCKIVNELGGYAEVVSEMEMELALKCGVKGYLLKQDYASILPAIRAVCTGQTVFGTQIISRLPELLERKSAFDYATYEITEKERAVMKLVADGKSNKEIAGEMFLSEGTIRNYISGILDKLNLRDRTQLAVFYLRNCT